MKLLRKIADVLNGIEEWFLVIGLGTMVIAMILQVFFRFVLNSPLLWSEVFIRYMYLWVVFLGISYGVRKGQHIYIGLLYDRLAEMAKKIIRVIINVIVIYFLTIQIPYGIKYCQSLMRVRVNGISFLPRGIVYWCLPIGYSTAIIRLLIECVLIFSKTSKSNKSKEEI